ncbi:MAG TPA: hypothetical protein VEV84_13965 [Pyrinomonadaceae bacterium]|nr:hypothetical protein [Pyrinomonadaceae bacterium]
MITQHRNVRSRLPVADQELLGQLTAQIGKQLFKNLPRIKLLGYTETLLRNQIPSLTSEEAKSLAEYVLGGIASNEPIGATAAGADEKALLQATKQMQETQMSFNLQYLQLQSQMQNENRQYTAVSNIMKTKHDTVKNSISNIR